MDCSDVFWDYLKIDVLKSVFRYANLETLVDFRVVSENVYVELGVSDYIQDY